LHLCYTVYATDFSQREDEKTGEREERDGEEVSNERARAKENEEENPLPEEKNETLNKKSVCW
jgi:hypothetical protein